MNKSAFAKRAIALLVCACLTVAFFFSAWFVAAHMHHDCTGQDCPVCALIHRFSDMLRRLGVLVMVLAAAMLAILTALHGALPHLSFDNTRENTPVSLKVQLNN